jgi:uncharacterized membrane protein
LPVAALSAVQGLIAIAIAGAISILVFWHADRHGSKHTTLWGVGTFLMAGVVAPVYVVQYLLKRRRS